MKKKIIILSLFFAIFFALSFSLNIKASTASYVNDTMKIDAMGRTVNVVKDSYFDLNGLNDNEKIFDDNWIESCLSEKIAHTDVTDIYEMSQGERISEQFQSYITENNISTSASAPIKMVKLAVKNQFDIKTEIEQNKYASQYYYNMTYKNLEYLVNMLENNDVSDYAANLSDEYKGYLNLLFRGAITPTAFFNKFGTHVIAKAQYGTKVELNYYVVSNYVDINQSISADIYNSLSASFLYDEDISATVETNFSIRQIVGDSYKYCHENLSIISFGEELESYDDISNFNNEYQQWRNEINENKSYVMVDIPNDGLIPLWDLLPSYYSSKKTQFKVWLEDYMDDNEVNLSSFNFKDNLGDSYTSGITHSIRPQEKEIVYEDELSNVYDKIDFFELEDYSPAIMKKLGYKTVKINITFDAKEKNHGYQSVHLYSEYSKDHEICNKEFELGGTSLQDEYIEYSVEFTLNINELYLYNEIYILYGNRGIFSDKWYNKNVTISFTYYK